MRDDCPYKTTPYLARATGDGARPAPKLDQPDDAGGQAQCPVCGALFREGESPICRGKPGEAP